MSETIAQSSSENYGKSVGTSAVVLAKGGGRRHSGSGVITVGGTINMPRYITVHNNHGSQVLYVGWGSDVSTSNGLPIPAGEHRTLRAWYDDELWAIASGSSTDTRVYVLHGKGSVQTFSPLDLSPLVWYDASDTDTISDTAGAVDTWSDKSGNGYDLTQVPGSAQPKTGTATINSLNVVEYDGSSVQWLDNTSAPIQGTSYTLFAVYQIPSGDSRFMIYNTSSTSGYAYAGHNGSASTVLTGAMSSTSMYVDAVEFTGTTRGNVYTAAALNTPILVRVTATSDTYNGIAFGYPAASAFAFGSGTVVAEAFLVASPTAQQISDAETYLADKWGITLP